MRGDYKAQHRKTMKRIIKKIEKEKKNNICLKGKLSNAKSK